VIFPYNSGHTRQSKERGLNQGALEEEVDLMRLFLYACLLAHLFDYNTQGQTFEVIILSTEEYLWKPRGLERYE